MVVVIVMVVMVVIVVVVVVVVVVVGGEPGNGRRDGGWVAFSNPTDLANKSITV